MHFAGVCTEPDPRQAAVMSNFGISLSAAAVISSPATTAAATRGDLNRNMTSFQTRLSPKDQRGPFSTDQLYPSSWTLGPMSALGQKQGVQRTSQCPLSANSGHSAIYSMISSARTRSEGGMVKPSALAVVRLIAKSNLVGCSTGKSPGLAPRKILSTKSAARRNRSG